MQVTKGDNTAERPMWAEKGGLDFDGRAKWDAWTGVKNAKPPKAKLNFVKVPITLFSSDPLVFPCHLCCSMLLSGNGLYS